MSFWRNYVKMTSFWRNNAVIIGWCVHWVQRQHKPLQREPSLLSWKSRVTHKPKHHRDNEHVLTDIATESTISLIAITVEPFATRIFAVVFDSIWSTFPVWRKPNRFHMRKPNRFIWENQAGFVYIHLLQQYSCLITKKALYCPVG